MNPNLDLFPADADRRCPLCGQPFSRGCMRCELRGADWPPVPPAVHREIEEREQAAAARASRLAALGRPVRLGLVSCSQGKLPGRHPARELYISPLFRLSLAYAEARCDEVRILSALHGVLDPDEVIDSYDRRLPQAHTDLLGWAMSATHRLYADYPRLPVHLVVVAGASYFEPLLMAGLPSTWTYEAPLRGLGIGHRLSFLSRSASYERARS